MAEKKIDNAEVMTEEQLDQVAGGTYKEYEELVEVLPQVEYKKGTLFKRTGLRDMTEAEATTWLSENLGIEADISTGKWNPFWNGNPNTYKKGDVSLSHTDVIQMVKDYRGIK